ncbi:MAG: transposase [Candidatus Buchananbacteria bacterium]|nr:transposase [Candidatus Buchananbacteria bacterium]
MARIFGIRHRIKQTKEGKAKPTQVAVYSNGNVQAYNLADETAELDWIKGKTPIKWREAKQEEDLDQYPVHHLKVSKTKTKVPAEYDGLQPGDQVVMVLGGSGDYLAFAISVRAEELPAAIHRVPPAILKDFRGEDKEDDSKNLIRLWQEKPQVFQAVASHERDFIRLRILYQGLVEARNARIACGQRIDQHTIGLTFCREDGFFPQGEVKKAAEEAKANDAVYQSLFKEEKRRAKEMEKHLETMAVYTQVFKPIHGCGPKIAARLLVAIGDINRFPTDAKLKAFCGVHVTPEGKFVRRRSGQVANWSGEARQALYLIVDQFIRRPESDWGNRFVQVKTGLREKHPNVICKTCSKDGPEVVWSDVCAKKKHKRAYNDGHIHNMAVWHTANKFVRWIYFRWTNLENQGRQQAA